MLVDYTAIKKKELYEWMFTYACLYFFKIYNVE